MPNNKDKDYKASDILHLKGMGFNAVTGYSVLGYAKKSIELGIALETFGSKFFGSGTHPSTIISHPHKLDSLSAQNLKESLKGAVGGLGKSHNTLLLDEGMKMENISIPPEESQFLSTRLFSINEIARFFNLPVNMLSDNRYSTYQNYEQMLLSFAIHTIGPWTVRLEQQYDSQLLLPDDRAKGYFFKFSMEGLLRGSPKARSEYYESLSKIGALTINEIRALENMAPVDGGDVAHIPMNSIALE